MAAISFSPFWVVSESWWPVELVCHEAFDVFSEHMLHPFMSHVVPVVDDRGGWGVPKMQHFPLHLILFPCLGFKFRPLMQTIEAIWGPGVFKVCFWLVFGHALSVILTQMFGSLASGFKMLLSLRVLVRRDEEIWGL